ncbi:drug/metabolite transporter (DMT)-like permease [Microbacterium natoriense]|uniref:Drug/metabolite transporter (DMT)-like permease n=1 Tax=Microbacterium natoriense TaxID=284570 RepID=A0AAW8F1M3_9MICO|nr:EamA family transporter [Microbacterium natoriense]MDQ0649706.1 drug/metabolite transporter (DMT)-like permease [Microbacterium natoriense]
MTTLADDSIRIASRPGVSRGMLVALGAAVSFGMSGVFARGLIDAGWSPGAAVTVRMWVAALVLLVPTLLALRGKWRIVRRNAVMVLVYGVLAVTLAQLCYFQAVAVMDVGIALLIEYTAPIAVVLWLWIRRGEKPTRRSLLGAAVAFVGLVLMLDILTGAQVNLGGILFALGAMIGAATYFVLSGRADTGLPPIALAGLGLLIGAVGLAIAALIGVLPFEWTTADVEYSVGSVPWFVPVLAMGLIATALAYILGIASTRMLGSRLSSFVALSEVVAAMVFSALMLGQIPGPVQAIGGALVLAGVVVVKLGEADAGAPSLVVEAVPVERSGPVDR